MLMLLSVMIPVNAQADETANVFDLIEITDFHGALEDSSTPALPVAVLAKDIKDVKNANPDRNINYWRRRYVSRFSYV